MVGDRPEPLRYLSADELDRALPMADAIDAMEAVFRDAGAGRATAPERTVLTEDLGGGRRSLLLTMPASWSGRGYGAKVTSFVGDNPAHGLPAVQGVAVLLDPATGRPLLLVPAGALTVRRTAAMVGLATRALARADAVVLGIIGTGALAADMIRAVAAVRSVERVVAYNRTPEKAARLGERVSREVTVAETPEEVAREADVLITATSSTSPVVDGAVIRPGTHVNAVGNFSPEGREIDGATMARASVWVDTVEGTLAEAGEILLAAAEGHLAGARESIRGDLAALASGPPTARTDREEITLFKSVGTALADIGALQAAHQAARSYDLGTVLDGAEG